MTDAGVAARADASAVSAIASADPTAAGAPTLAPQGLPVHVVPSTVAVLRRCVHRRLSVVKPGGRGREAAYAVECLYRGRGAPEPPVPLGDIHAAATVCGSCAYPGRFREDED